MKRCEAMQPIILRGTKAVRAAEDAKNRSIKKGRAMHLLKMASAEQPILRRKEN